jgi:hypothetical protein
MKTIKFKVVEMMKNHKENCECEICKNGLEAVRKREAEWIEKYGFFVDYVPLDEYHINAHTHGLMESKEHMDFQIVLPLDQELANKLFWSFVHQINEGANFEDKIDEDINSILNGYPVRLIKTIECKRDVLRVLFPDKNGKFPTDVNCEEAFKHQLDTLE